MACFQRHRLITAPCHGLSLTVHEPGCPNPASESNPKSLYEPKSAPISLTSKQHTSQQTLEPTSAGRNQRGDASRQGRAEEQRDAEGRTS